ncbi:MAG TPA: hypothetical protein PK014_10270 [Thermoanaerobaculia bacterium]|nr:hypothetical protein [Thermoanaerobaculia bacterium]HUM30504.1 hypothetical protein [Thermoanaerobaculia bacterium]HXK68629.1 hypothetical protein [Thermoanaerobaculia bacterium]
MKQLTLLVLVFFFCVSLFGYVVYLKDGSTYMAREKYMVEGDYAIITLQNGSVIKVKMNLIDVKKTDDYNAKGLTSGEVIELGTSGSSSTTTDKPRVSPLSDLAKRKPAKDMFGSGSSDSVDIREGSGQAEGSKVPFRDEGISRSFVVLFENQNLFQYRIYQGRKSTSMRVEMTTDNENEVFRTVSSVAKKLNEYVKTSNKKLDQVELFMATSAGAPAGRFIITPESASELANGKVTVEAFFVQNVIF